jgi:hypothetical protein
MEKLSLKTSKAMKLSESYLFKKSKSDVIISFTFPFIDIRNQKTTPRLGDSPTREVAERKKTASKSSFRTRRSSFPLQNLRKRPEYDNFGLFLRPSIITLYKKSSLYFKSVDFLPKNDRYVCSQTVVFIKILSIKKVQSIKVATILT